MKSELALLTVNKVIIHEVPKHSVLTITHNSLPEVPGIKFFAAVLNKPGSECVILACDERKVS